MNTAFSVPFVPWEPGREGFGPLPTRPARDGGGWCCLPSRDDARGMTRRGCNPGTVGPSFGGGA